MGLEKDRIREYLLGSATEHERETVEMGVIEDKISANEIFIAESELIEDYLEESLSEAEREMFEKNFLTTEDRRDRVNEIRLLKRFSSGPHRFDLGEDDEDESV